MVLIMVSSQHLTQLVTNTETNHANIRVIIKISYDQFTCSAQNTVFIYVFKCIEIYITYFVF